MKLSLPAFAIKRPVTVTMLSLSMLVIGVIAWYSMPLKFLPRVDRPVISCYIPYPGGSPEQVEQQITIPVEGEFRTIPGLDFISTNSTGDGCNVFMRFNLDTDMTLATAEVRDRMERLKLVLPDEVDKMLLQRFSSGSIPVLAFGLFREGDQEDFTHHIRTIVEPRISRLDGVAKVEVHSPIQEKEVLIEFDQDTLRSINLGLAEVIATLQQSSLNVSVGQLIDGESKYYVRAQGEYRRIEEIAALVISPSGLRLNEVAQVRYSARQEDVHVSLDGKGGVVLLVIKESEANTVSTCQRVHKELAGILSERGFQNTSKLLFFDQAELISRALHNLMMEGLYGGAMALMVLFIFLHRILPTIIVALAIPTSLVVALVYMFFTDMSLNLVTMVSMIIAVGMLVDNAIVVVENIIRHRQLGESPIESARKGATEVGLAIFAATSTTAVVFLPMFYLETGRMSVFTEQLGLPLIVSLAGSLLIALTVIPLAMSRMGDPKHTNIFFRFEALISRKNEREVTKGRSLLSRMGRLHLVQRTIAAYAYFLRLTLSRRLAAIFCIALLIWITYTVPFKSVGMRDLPKLDTREVAINIDLDQNYDMPMARKLFTTIKDSIEGFREELAIKNILCFHESDGGVIEVYLYTEDDGPLGENPPYKTQEVMEFLRERIPKRMPGATIKLRIADAGHSGSSHGISLRMRGDDATTLEKHAEEFKNIIATIPMLKDPTTDIERNKQEMQLRIDEALAEKAGISPAVIAQSVDAALRGSRMPYMKQDGREVSVWAQFREEDRKSKANLDNVSVTNALGELTPLNQLVDYGKAKSPSAIRRVNGKNVIQITAKTETEDLSHIQGQLRQRAAKMEMPVGYTIEFGDELEELSENVFQFSTMLFMAIILIYLVMSALFESFLLPLSILTSVPLALGGGIWMLYFTNMQIDTVTLIGNILMVGVIVNNGIVIVDHINNLRKDRSATRLHFSSREDAIVQAGKDRFRPVMMTAITTILGLVPLALAETGGASTFRGLGRALIGGLTVGTLLTLLVVPLFYTILDDIQSWTVNFLAGFSKLKPTRK